MKRRIFKIAAFVLGAAALVAFGLHARRAFAFGPGGWHHGRMREMVTAHIDEALDAAKANDAQRNAIHAARDHVFATLEQSRRGHKGDFERALALFEADRVDPAQIAALRAEHEAEAQRVGDAIVQAVSDAHDALTAPQRRLVADYARGQRPSHRGNHHGFMKRMVLNRVDEALDVAKATPPQRAAVRAAAERAIAAVMDGRPQEGPSQAFDQALSLFEADKLDHARIAQVRAEHVAHMRKTGDAILAAVQDAHAALNPAQRKAVADWIRAQRPADME
jgi:periplasmic protein CpxP/Spy